MQSFKIKINGKYLTGFKDPNTRTNGVPDFSLIQLSEDDKLAIILEGAFNVGCVLTDVVQNMRYYHNVKHLELMLISEKEN